MSDLKESGTGPSQTFHLELDALVRFGSIHEQDCITIAQQLVHFLDVRLEVQDWKITYYSQISGSSQTGDIRSLSSSSTGIIS